MHVLFYFCDIFMLEHYALYNTNYRHERMSIYRSTVFKVDRKNALQNGMSILDFCDIIVRNNGVIAEF